MRRRTCLTAVVVWCALLPAVARAEGDPEKEACIREHADSQKLRRNGKLGSARELLLACARETCPAPIRAECGQWSQEVEASMPSILVEVRGSDGSSRSDVEVWIDAKRVAKSLSGMPLPLDPGEREIEVRPSGRAPIRRRVLVNIGEKRRSVVFTLSGRKRPQARVTPRPQAERPRSGIPTATVIVGSIGLVSLGVGGYFGYRAQERANELDECRPNCDRGEADSMREQALVADVAFGVGALAIGLATYLWLSGDEAPASARGTPIGLAF